MSRVKVRRDDQITLSAEVRQKLDVAEGDYIDVEVVEAGVLLKPVLKERDPRVDAAIAEGRADVQTGRVTPSFESVEEFEAYRQSDAYKALIRDGA